MTVPDKYGESNYPKAIVISFIIMTALILLSFWWIVSRPEPIEEVGTGGIIVNYGTSPEGMGDNYMSMEEPSMDPNANNKAPDKVIPDATPQQNPVAQTSDKEIVTQDVEDAPTVSTTQKKTSAAPSVTPPTKESKPTVNPNALYKGNKNNASGLGDGTTTTPGNQGDPQGDPLAANYGEGGSGNGNRTPPGRAFVKTPDIQDNSQLTGTILIQYRVNNAGTIIEAHVLLKGTTITDTALQNKCKNAILGSRLNASETSAGEQTGVYRFIFKVN